MAAQVDYAQAGELKIGQVGIANLRIRTLDVAQLTAEMRERVQRAPKLFGRAAVIVDFGGLAKTPDLATARALLDGLGAAGVLPVALAYGTSENDALAQALGLPLLSKFRAQYESVDSASAAQGDFLQGGGAAAAAGSSQQQQKVAVEAAAAKSSKVRANAGQPAASAPGLIQKTPVRSGQQVYAENRDLTVLTAVGAGAEVIADGSIHIYGALRGRALAGAQGDENARIFCREFQAELVAVAGHYKVLEEIPKELRGKAVQIWLDNEQLHIAALD